MSNVRDLPSMVDLVVVLATANVHNLGGPFGATLISPDGTRFHHGTNRVTASSDPTAHAEVTAIRNACEAERTHDLTGWTLVTSCYPCPMCLGAALWARVDRIVYAATPDQAAAAGFDDRAFHDQFRAGTFTPEIVHLTGRVDPISPFATWEALEARIDY